MSSPFIAKPAAPASPVGSTFTVDGWWPDIDITAMRAALRVGEAVTHERLIFALESAVVTVADDLDDWRIERERQGYTSLAAVDPDRRINGKSRLVSLFVGAVRYAAQAILMDESTDLSATASDETRADAKRDTADHYETMRLNNVRSIKAVTRVAVELI